ncbi:tyrosine-protein phosphatase [Cellulomonas rhizosphaerae]|uniref:Tyrosine-protein phosphatase n=1 Tax=Cellulomonas rhizosphaerae TaxID=2293719 RepID=A0A413RJ71_9CELL|nr:tyrosine-protein phosphatase [Cellulomonas rhizosphaerae]RHA38591.1 tyrosine-protein phosphatase [Cellulomonas rhizosphaerae]
MTDLHRIANVHLGNLRDLGGRPTRDGALVATGVVFRSAELADEAIAGDPELAALGLRTIVDLRTGAEREARPDRVPAGAQLVELDVLADLPTGAAAQVATLFEEHGGRIEGHDVVDQMRSTYRSFVTSAAARQAYAGLVRVVIDPARVPVLFHCTAGKDRTGWAATILLLAAGVTREEVADEYLAVNPAVRAAYAPLLAQFAASGGDPAALAPFLEVRADYLQAAFDQIDASYGSFDAYLRDGLGLTDVEVETLGRTLRAG